MVELRDSSLETVTRTGRRPEAREPVREPREERQINVIEKDFIETRGRWAPEEVPPCQRALRDRNSEEDANWPPRPPADIRRAPRRDTSPPEH
eukprot:12148581-Karenia_brevis.AAC.1